MRTKIVLVLAAILLAPAAARANGYDVPNVAARDLALSDSARAAQNDAAAAYANPAALARLDEGLNLSLYGAFLDNSSTWTAPAGSLLGPSPQETRFRPPLPPYSLFAAYGFKLFDRKAGVGLGSNIPAGGNVFWPDNWAGRGRIIEVNRKVYGFYVTGGYEVYKGIRLGGGFVYYYTHEYLKQGIQPDPTAFAELSASGGMASYDVSAEVTPLESIPLTLGIDYKHQAVQQLHGSAHFNVPPALQPLTPPDQSVTHTLTYPGHLHIAAAYRPVKPVLVLVGYELTLYSVYKEDRFIGNQGTTIVVTRNYRNGNILRAGVEWDAIPGLQLRLGGLRDWSGVRSLFYSPTIPTDGNAWVVSGGGGYDLGRTGWNFLKDVTANLGVFYAWVGPVTLPSNSAELLGSYKTNVLIVSAGITYRNDLSFLKH